MASLTKSLYCGLALYLMISGLTLACYLTEPLAPYSGLAAKALFAIVFINALLAFWLDWRMDAQGENQ